MGKKHDFDSAWKSILEVFEMEIVELLFPELYDEIAWELGAESLDNELQEIQKDIFDKHNSKKVISDKILKVQLKEKKSKILFIHVEVQSYNDSDNIFGERMFRYFYRIWDKFRYKYDDQSEIVGAAIYTYKGTEGKNERYVYKIPKIKEDILIYNFRTIDVETINLENISEDNPLKLVFKMAKRLINSKMNDEDIYKAKIELADELNNYDNVKNNVQIMALVDFLEYLFLIENTELERKFEKYKKEKGGKFKMSIDEIRKIHYTEEGKEEGKQEGTNLGIEKTIQVQKMLMYGKTFEEIEKETGLNNTQIEKIAHALSAIK